MSKSGKITLKQIAERVGCSTAAVSYAIRRNRPLTEELKKRIFKAIDELGYQPYSISSSPQMMSVAVFASDFAGTIIYHFRDELLKRNLLMELFLLPPVICWKNFEAICRNFHKSSSHLLGIINLHPEINSFDLLKYGKNIPSVIYYREGSMCSHVTLQLKEVGILAARQLALVNQHKAAFLVHQDENSVYADQVYMAMREYLQQKRSEFQLIKLVYDPENISVQLNQIYNDGIRILCPNGVPMASDALRWAYVTHRRIPDDLSFLCIDYTDEASKLWPPLSSVEFPHKQMVHETVNELISLINHRTPTIRFFYPYFVDRGSIIV